MLSHRHLSPASLANWTILATLINRPHSSLTTQHGSRTLASMRFPILFLLASVMFPSVSHAQAPVFEFTTGESTIKFDVKASVAIVGKFEKWDASLTMTSPELSTAVLDIKIQAATVNTGSGMKDGKLKSKDFFDVENAPFTQLRLHRLVPIRSYSTATLPYVA